MSLQSQPAPGDQRRTLIAVALITLVFFVWMWMAPAEAPPTNQQPPVTDTSQAQQRAADQAQEQEALSRQQQDGEQAPQAGADEAQAGSAKAPPGTDVSDTTLAAAQQGTARKIVVETDLYEATFSTKGATPTSLTLKKYDNYDEETPVQLVDTAGTGALSLAFTTPESNLVNTRALYFEPRLATGSSLSGDTLRVSQDSTALAFETTLGPPDSGGTLRQVYTFYPERYEMDLRVEQENAQRFATNEGYELVWDGGLPYTEASPQAEAQNAGAFARSGGEVEGIRLSDGDTQEKRLTGSVDWTAVKNKYFTVALLPASKTRGAELVGEKVAGKEASWENYTMRLQMPQQRTARQSDSFRLYLGPIDYYKLSRYDLDLYDMVDYGWDFFEWMTRPIAKYVLIPVFKALHSAIPSYGIVIILLAILVKMVVYPLTKSSYKSMAKMRELQPRMEEIREEYADDQEQQQKQMMKMYKETGVNPLGGCLPMLLQYPVIITLYQFLPTAIDIRQQSFLWAHDLSVPDVILNLPFDIPFYGSYVAGFTVLMGLSMMVSMNLQSTGGSGGQMQYMKYFMPIFIVFIFNRFAAGLSLYYLFYNIMTAIQQKYINNQIEKEKEEDPAGGNGAGSKYDIREARRRHRRETAKT